MAGGKMDKRLRMGRILRQHLPVLIDLGRGVHVPLHE